MTTIATYRHRGGDVTEVDYQGMTVAETMKTHLSLRQQGWKLVGAIQTTKDEPMTKRRTITIVVEGPDVDVDRVKDEMALHVARAVSVDRSAGTKIRTTFQEDYLHPDKKQPLTLEDIRCSER